MGRQSGFLYEEYEFDYLEFYYTSECSQYAPQGQTGTIVLSADYDASDNPPTTKQMVEDTEPHSRPCLPSTPLVTLKLDCALMKKNLGKYVRTGNPVANTDIKTYDSGNFYVTTQGCTNTANIGELHVRYRCHLKTPVLNSLTYGAQAAHFVTRPLGNNFIAGTTFQSGSSAFLTGGMTFGNNSLAFGPGMAGSYLIIVSSSGASAQTAVVNSISANGSGYLATAWSNSLGVAPEANTIVSGPNASVSQDIIFACVLQVSAFAGGLTCAISAPLVGTCYGDIYVSLLPSTLLSAPNPTVAAEEELSRKNDALMARIARLEGLLSPPELGSNEECKEPESPELEKSIHVTKSMLEKMLQRG